MCVCACSVAQLCLTLCDPMDCSLPGSSVQRIFQARILEWITISSSGDLPNSGKVPCLLQLLHWRQILYHRVTQKLNTATAAKSLQSCPTLCDPIDDRPPGSPVPGILQARILEWVAVLLSIKGDKKD